MLEEVKLEQGSGLNASSNRRPVICEGSLLCFETTISQKLHATINHSIQ